MVEQRQDSVETHRFIPLARFRFPLAVYLPSMWCFCARSHSVTLRSERGRRRRGIERGRGGVEGLGAARASWVAREKRHETAREYGSRCMAGEKGGES